MADDIALDAVCLQFPGHRRGILARGLRADRRLVMSAIVQHSEKTALVLFSGGQESATCLAWALMSPVTSSMEPGTNGICPDNQTVLPTLIAWE